MTSLNYKYKLNPKYSIENTEVLLKYNAGYGKVSRLIVIL